MCIECPAWGDRLPSLFGVGGCLIALFVLLALLLLHPGVSGWSSARCLRKWLLWAVARARGLGLLPKIKICFSFYGISTVIGSTYDAKLPQSYTDWVDPAFGWVSFDWGNLLMPMECAASGYNGFRSWLLVTAIVPLAFVGITILAAILQQTYLQQGFSLTALKRGVLNGIPVALVVSFAFCPSVSGSIFRSWLCVAYRVSNDQERSFLRAQLSVTCSSGSYSSEEHDAIISMATIFVIIWPIGFVVLYAVTLLKCRGAIQSRTYTPLVAATRFLHRDFSPEWYWWECLEVRARTNHTAHSNH